MWTSTDDDRSDLHGVEKTVIAFLKIELQIYTYVGSPPPYKEKLFRADGIYVNTFEPAACWTMTSEARKDAAT